MFGTLKWRLKEAAGKAVGSSAAVSFTIKPQLARAVYYFQISGFVPHSCFYRDNIWIRFCVFLYHFEVATFRFHTDNFGIGKTVFKMNTCQADIASGVDKI